VIASSDTCLAIGTIAEGDGEVEVLLTDDPIDASGLVRVGAYSLRMEMANISVETIYGTQLLHCESVAQLQDIECWVSGLIEPDRIVIALKS